MPMILFAAALATASPLPHVPAAMAQATVTIRVISAVRLKLDADENPDAPRARYSQVKMSDGSTRPAKLIEFQ